MNRLLASALALLAPACAFADHPYADPTEGRRVIEAADGTPIVVEVHVPKYPAVGKPTLVFVHCWAGNRHFWKEQVPDLSQDHVVVTLDLPGHGESGHDRSEWRIADLGRDVADVVEELELRFVVLVGHSMGGPVSLEAARLLPSRAVGVVAVDTLHNAEQDSPPDVIEQWAQGFEADFDSAMAGGVEYFMGAHGDPALKAWITAEALRTDRAAAIGLIRDFPNLDLAHMFARCRVPIRAINAAPQDTPQGPLGMPTTIEQNREYADYDAVILQDVGHYLQLERPAEVNAALRRFLAEF